MNERLLLIDDDTRLATMVGDYLRGHGFEVEHAGTLAAGRERLQRGSYDALLLDLMLPDGDGLELTRELLARVKALLRRAAPEPQADDVLVFGRLEIDLGARQARLDGRPCRAGASLGSGRSFPRRAPHRKPPRLDAPRGPA